ncbi:uncharacterized protein LOC117336720 [Pecten maximus]|uniref:uncharacterized protein LOC117336720 n=1 Tax=Pecten maximus TaxID=6579 RepID=UPI001458E863|nr:uncharacterized protein LOC117336720 [Pecten maximus]
MGILAYTCLLLSLGVLTCVSLCTDEENRKSRRQIGQDGASTTLTVTGVHRNRHQKLVTETLHGPNVCNTTIEYYGIVEETFIFIWTARKPCGDVTARTTACTDGFYTKTETGVGVRNVTRKMIKMIPECCSLHKEEKNLCVKDTVAIISLVVILSVLVGVVSFICLCCYCCCCRRKKVIHLYIHI